MPRSTNSARRRAYEQGFLYWQAEDYARAKPYLEQSVEGLEQLARWGETRREYGVTFARATDRLASVLDRDPTMRDRVTKYFVRSRDIFRALCQRYPDDTDCLFGLSIAYERMYLREENDEKSLALLDQALETLQKALTIRPNSPQFVLYRGLYLQEKADQLSRMKRPDDALKASEESVAKLSKSRL